MASGSRSDYVSTKPTELSAPTPPYVLTRREAFALELYARALRDDMGEQLTDMANASVRGADALIEQLDAIDPNEDGDSE